MAMFLILLSVFCSRHGVQSLMDFPALSYKEPAANGARVGSPSLGFSLHGPALAMESLVSHAEGALDELSSSMGIPFSKSKTKTNIHVDKGISSLQARPASWTLQGKEVKPTSSLQPPCSHLSSDQNLNSHKLPESLAKVDVYHPSSNTLPLAPIPSKVDISTNQQYISLPKVEISTNHRDTPLSEKELNSNLSSNVQVNSYLIPAYSHQHSAYAVKEHPESHIDEISAAASSVPMGINSHHHSISPFYKQPQVFSHTSGAPLSLQLSGPSYPTFGTSSNANTNAPTPYVSASVASHFSSSSPMGDLPVTNRYVVPSVSLPHMINGVQNHSEIPVTETQVKVNSLYSSQQFPPYTYFPYGSFCHHSKSNLPPLSGSVLPRPFTVGYQHHQHITPAVPYYAASPQIPDETNMPQLQQNYYYLQNEAVHQGPSIPANIHTSYNQ